MSEKSHYTPPPPIPSYDEATAGDASSSQQWQDPRTEHEVESQSLLPSARTGGNNPRAPRGYQPPRVDSDDEESLWSLQESDDEDDETADAQVRREMQELEMEDGQGGLRSRASMWRKRIGLSLPTWKWRWRLPRLTVQLPRANPITTNPVNDDDDSDSETPRTTPGGWRERWEHVNKGALLLMVARLVVLFAILGFLYALFMGDLFGNMSRHLGSQMFDPEVVRQHVMTQVDPGRLRDTVDHFSAYAHIAGTEGDFALADDMVNEFLRSGLEEVILDPYHVMLNYPTLDGRAVEVIGEQDQVTWAANIEELDIGGEVAGHQTWAFHGHSMSGDVRGPLIYANYGSRKDFEKLKNIGIDTVGAIALVRYYGPEADAGLKVLAAQEAGFVGCILYNDPADDGFVKGDVAPGGRFMPKDAVHRSSVSLTNYVIGDVLTPGWESKDINPRVDINQTIALVGIPSIPLGWRDAEVLLRQLDGFGEKCPDKWQGGVPNVGWWSGNASSPVVRLKNEQDVLKEEKIWNVYAKIEGVEQSEKAIIIGAHRDAWSFGATDPGSGTAILLEVARVFGDLVSRGWRPLRTIQFMSWDGAAYNFIGSTEFVEAHLKNLQQNALAYINLDAAVSGNKFHAAASPVFKKSLYRILERIIDPYQNATLAQLWDDRDAHLEPLGVRSDYVPFLDLAGTSSIDLRFDGPGFPQHSSYDNFEWVSNVGDPGFGYHAMLAQVVALLILELTGRPVLPFDMTSYADSLGSYMDDLAKWVRKQTGDDQEDRDSGRPQHFLKPIRQAIADVQNQLGIFNGWEDSWLDALERVNGWEPEQLGQQRCEYNSRMGKFETDLLDLGSGGGLPNRTQYKHVIHGPRLWSSQPGEWFPGIRDAVEQRDWDLAAELVNRTADIIWEAGQNLLLRM